jgi:hypothetical protein
VEAQPDPKPAPPSNCCQLIIDAIFSFVVAILQEHMYVIVAFEKEYQNHREQ